MDAIKKHYWLVSNGSEAHRIIAAIRAEYQAVTEEWREAATKVQKALNLPEFNEFRFVIGTRNPPRRGERGKVTNIVFSGDSKVKGELYRTLKEQGITTIYTERNDLRINGRSSFIKRLPEITGDLRDLPDLRRSIMHDLRELTPEASKSDYFSQLMDGVGIREVANDAFLITGGTDAWGPILEPAGAGRLKASEAIRLVEEAEEAREKATA